MKEKDNAELKSLEKQFFRCSVKERLVISEKIDNIKKKWSNNNMSKKEIALCLEYGYYGKSQEWLKNKKIEL